MNKTDHDSRMMRSQGEPTVQGYNAQAAVTRGQIIVAAEITVSGSGCPLSGITPADVQPACPPRRAGCSHPPAGSDITSWR